MTYQPMTAATLDEHRAGEAGRDYRFSCDGYGDMEHAERHGWRVLATWGRDGWNLGKWPYVTIYTAVLVADERYGLLQIVEGDHTVYTFETEEERTAAIDYLFLWYAAGKRWAPLTEGDREALDKGELIVDEMWRGPYREERT